MLGEDVSEEEKAMLLSLNDIIDEYEQAIKTKDWVKKRVIAKKYKKAYKKYQLMMVDK